MKEMYHLPEEVIYQNLAQVTHFPTEQERTHDALELKNKIHRETFLWKTPNWATGSGFLFQRTIPGALKIKGSKFLRTNHFLGRTSKDRARRIGVTVTS